jgi:hypothetical protein
MNKAYILKKAANKEYSIKWLGKKAYERIIDPLASIADMSYFNTDDMYIVTE